MENIELFFDIGATSSSFRLDREGQKAKHCHGKKNGQH